MRGDEAESGFEYSQILGTQLDVFSCILRSGNLRNLLYANPFELFGLHLLPRLVGAQDHLGPDDRLSFARKVVLKVREEGGDVKLNANSLLVESVC